MSLIWLLFVLNGLAIAISDFLTFRIPNMAIIAFLGLFGVAAGWAAVNHVPVPWLDHVAAGALSLAAGLLLYGYHQMGAGDAKLLAVMALWAGLSRLLPLLFAWAVSALVILALILLARRFVAARPIWENSKLPRVLRRRESIPYGLGIVLGAIMVSGAFPSWLWRV